MKTVSMFSALLLLAVGVGGSVPIALAQTADAAQAIAQDPFYCGERKLGTWFYCDKPKAEVKDAVAAPAPPAEPTLSAVERLKKLTDELAELKAAAILEPSPDNVTAYIQFQRQQLDRSSLFADVWQRQIWQNPALDYTLMRPQSTLAKRALTDARNSERDVVMAQLAERYGVFYFYSSSCAACDIASPIMKAVSDKYGMNVLAVSMDGGPNNAFGTYAVNTGQYEKMGLEGGQVPALVLFDSVTKQPIPIGYGILSQDEIMDRIFQLTQVAVGGDM